MDLKIAIRSFVFRRSCAEFSRIWADQIGALNTVAARETIYDNIMTGNGKCAIKFSENYCNKFFHKL